MYPEQLKTAVRKARHGTRFATCLLTKSGFGSLMHPGLDARFEKSQNLVSTKVLEVIESLRASRHGNGIAVMFKVTMSTMNKFSDEFK